MMDGGPDDGDDDYKPGGDHTRHRRPPRARAHAGAEGAIARLSMGDAVLRTTSKT